MRVGVPWSIQRDGSCCRYWPHRGASGPARRASLVSGGFCIGAPAGKGLASGIQLLRPLDAQLLSPGVEFTPACDL